jgi:hypothetical protein
MMNLEYYISEAISGKRKNSRNRLFSDEPSRDEVIDLLKRLDFVQTKTFTGKSIDGNDTGTIRFLIRIFSNGTGKIYNVGNGTSTGTDWIEFGNKDWFFKLRLGKGFKEFNDGSSYCSMRMYDLNGGTYSDRLTTFTDIVEFENEIINKLL